MLKKIISKISVAKTQAHKLPFWQWIERREKIRRLSNELNGIRQKTYVDGQGNWLVDYREFKELYRIAQQQQKLLTKK